VARMLVVAGYEVDTACDGAEALKVYGARLALGTPYSAVILDLTIPGGMGGQETAEKLLELHPEACLIASSGYGDVPVMAHFEDYGFSGRLRKPVDMDELEEVVSKATV
jgi:two-component system, cell cycle sensor histidine kinase and response regulator CckA